MSDKNQHNKLEARLGVVSAVVGLMVGSFAILQAILPSGLTPPIAALVVGLISAVVLVWSGKWTWQIAFVTLASTATILFVIQYTVSQPATVVGYIVQDDGTPIVGLSLTLTNSNGVDQRIVTDQSGRFEVNGVPSGRYTITSPNRLLFTGEIPSGWQRVFNPSVTIGTLPMPATPTPVLTTIATSLASATVTNMPTESDTQSISSAQEGFYDDFSNIQYENALNPQFWIFSDEIQGAAVQSDAILNLTNDGSKDDIWLEASYRFPLREPVYIQADLMTDVDMNSGVVRLVLVSDVSRNEAFGSDCLIADGELAYCTYSFSRNDQIIDEYGESYIEHVETGTWHTFRIEVAPPEMTFDFYMDGRLIGSHTPDQADIMRDAVGRLGISVYGSDITGHIDNVRIGTPDR